MQGTGGHEILLKFILRRRRLHLVLELIRLVYSKVLCWKYERAVSLTIIFANFYRCFDILQNCIYKQWGAADGEAWNLFGDQYMLSKVSYDMNMPSGKFRSTKIVFKDTAPIGAYNGTASSRSLQSSYYYTQTNIRAPARHEMYFPRLEFALITTYASCLTTHHSIKIPHLSLSPLTPCWAGHDWCMRTASIPRPAARRAGGQGVH